MQARTVTEILERADRAAALPRLGGMARPDGVVIVSERFWAFAGTDGSLREGTMPSTPNSLRAIPLARGLVSAMGGSVQAHSDGRTGTRMEVRLRLS